jgi:transketolase
MKKNLNFLIKKIITATKETKEGHIGSSLSILDILWVLYENFHQKDNVIILSKGHACLALYVVLNEKKLISDSDLNSFSQYDGKLGGHPDKNKIKHVYASTGSLGHGLPIAIGAAIAKKIKNEEGRVFAIIGDGESNEGTIWESLLLAKQHNLDNLTCIVDHNRSNDRSIKFENVLDKFSSFGWDCLEINGHNQDEIKHSLELSGGSPYAIIANTIKGKGIKRMENQHEWHHKAPNEREYKEIMEELSVL